VIIIVPPFSAGALFVLLCVAAFALETALLYFFPAILSAFAFLPAGGIRTVTLPARARDALSVSDPVNEGYRLAPVRALDLRHLGGPPRVDGGWDRPFILFFDPGRSRFLARLGWTWENRHGPLARISVRPIGVDQIELRARFVPANPFSNAAVLGAGILAGIPFCVGVGLFWLGWASISGRKETVRLLDAAADDVRRRLSAL
jgi:hypothetical protein